MNAASLLRRRMVLGREMEQEHEQRKMLIASSKSKLLIVKMATNSHQKTQLYIMEEGVVELVSMGMLENLSGGRS